MPTTPEIVTYDGVVLNQYCFNISTGAGRYHIPDRRSTTKLILPGKSGYSVVPLMPVNEGEATWSMWVQGTNTDGTLPGKTMPLLRAKFEANLDALMTIFGNQTGPRHATAVQPDGSTRECWAEVWDVIEPTTMAGRTRAEFSVTLLIPSVYWQDVGATTTVGVAGATLPKTVDLVGLAGSQGLIEDAVLTVAGPITNPRVTDVETGVWVQYTGTVANGNNWVVDAGQGISKVANVDQTANTSHGGHPLYYVIPAYATGQAYSTATLSGSVGGAATNLTVVARRKFYGG